MLTTLPAYAVYSAMYFQDSTPEPVVPVKHANPRICKKKQSVRDEEEYVFV